MANIWKDFIEKEINEQRQWKLLIEDVIACNGAIAFSDKEIWGEKDKDDSIYIHRIATNPLFRGNRYIDRIVSWAKEYAKQKARQFVRLDTLGNNTGLIKYYTSAGFQFFGNVWISWYIKFARPLPGWAQLLSFWDRSNSCVFLKSRQLILINIVWF